jgi:hypothetical protein
MKQAEQALRRAAASLKANDADGAIGNQEQAADILAEAFELVTIQNEQLGFLQNLLMFQRSVGFAYGYMGDIVSEQRDMIAATKALKSDDISDLELQFEHLKTVYAGCCSITGFSCFKNGCRDSVSLCGRRPRRCNGFP